MTGRSRKKNLEKKGKRNKIKCMPKFKKSIKFIAMKGGFMTWRGYTTEERTMLAL